MAWGEKLNRLDTESSGRDNNFNLIRIVAAALVLASHAWPMTYGRAVPEPLEAYTNYSLGELAVYVFFGLSGYLITGSYLRTKDPVQFIKARALRLFPGLAVSLALVGFVMGPMVTTFPPIEYLLNSRTWLAFLRNLTLFSNQFGLPGVFKENLNPGVQGSIWTLKYEVGCYLMVLILGRSGLLYRGWPMVFLAVFATVGWMVLLPYSTPPASKLFLPFELALPFVIGMAFWIWRDAIPLNMLVLVALACVAFAFLQARFTYPILVVFLIYGTLWFAYRPRGLIRAYNRVGDYSYGTYIYAWPLQELVVWLWHPATPLIHIALALPLTLVAAVLSWHLIERPALAVLRRMRQAHQIDVKDRVDHPVEAVFDARVGADGAGETL